jgi:amino acid permease
MFTTKPLVQRLEEMLGEHRLRRVLGPVQLTSLGVGTIVGVGIVVATGAAAHNIAGPTLMPSLPVENWYQLIVWLAIGLVIYFGYSRKHSELRRLTARGR